MDCCNDWLGRKPRLRATRMGVAVSAHWLLNSMFGRKRRLVPEPFLELSSRPLVRAELPTVGRWGGNLQLCTLLPHCSVSLLYRWTDSPAGRLVNPCIHDHSRVATDRDETSKSPESGACGKTIIIQHGVI